MSAAYCGQYSGEQEELLPESRILNQVARILRLSFNSDASGVTRDVFFFWGVIKSECDKEIQYLSTSMGHPV